MKHALLFVQLFVLFFLSSFSPYFSELLCDTFLKGHQHANNNLLWMTKIVSVAVLSVCTASKKLVSTAYFVRTYSYFIQFCFKRLLKPFPNFFSLVNIQHFPPRFGRVHHRRLSEHVSGKIAAFWKFLVPRVLKMISKGICRIGKQYLWRK